MTTKYACSIGDGRCVSGQSIFRFNYPILGCFTRYEGFFRQIMLYCTGENAAGMTILFSCAT